MDGNAIITRTALGQLGRGFSSYIYLRQGMEGQGFGGRSLGAKYLHCWVKRILEVVGVDTWEELVGKHVRVAGDDFEIKGIGNIIEDKWFYPEEEFNEIRKLTKDNK